MLLLSPPLCKPCEPPAALGYLAAALHHHGIQCTTVDLNIEALSDLLLSRTPAPGDSTWTARALRNREAHLAGLKGQRAGANGTLYTNVDRYKRAVADLNHLLELAGAERSGNTVQLSLANYQDRILSPQKSADLRRSAREFSANIFYPYFSKRLEELLDLQPGPVGLSCNFLSQALTAFAIIGYLRRVHPKRTIILGGGLVTTWLSQPSWTNPFADLVDHLIPGKGEEPLLRLLTGKGGRIIPTPNFRFAAANRSSYLAPGFILPYSGSFGCFWKKCSFCPEKSENNPFIHIAPQITGSSLSQLVSDSRPGMIHFLDNAISPATLKHLAARPPGSPWYGFVRFDRLLTDLDFCRALKTSGCVMLKLGLESGDQAVLDRMEKGIDLQRVSTVLENLRRAGIKTYIYLLFGTPQEDPRAARRTMAFVENHAECISFLNLAIFNLPRFSPEAATLDLSDFYEGDLSIYTDFTHPSGWNRNRIRRFLDTEFRKSEKIAPILRRDPPYFTSNHAPFLYF